MAVDNARVKSLFLAASDLADPAERVAYLDGECRGNDELRRRVEALLQANDAAPLPSLKQSDATLTHAPSGQVPTAAYADLSASVGTVIAGKYKLVEEIGAGGMGSVFMAQQTEPVKRAVAVKVIKAGMDSKAVLARFEAERQALAIMDHPNIAKVLDAGTTEAGRPFFVMELVKGVPITQFCDDRKLAPQERLELFVPVCQAIQHAHQKGIIHRDIKPTNVLVSMYDDKPVPKVIDFGIAKGTGQALTDRTLMTGFGAIVGTPEYMSPEQANFNQLDVDTRSDVYALGVLLYELLTGTTPIDRQTLGKAAFLEILRMVREVDVPRPSTKLSTSEALPSIAARRNTEPGKLSRLLQGELDWILLKALEKDRTRRYETANGLAADIQRYLTGEPVQAVPPSTGYRLRKFLKRNRGPVAATTMLLFALIGGLVGTAYGLVQAQQSRQEAVAARDAEVGQRQLAEAERDQREKARLAEAEQRVRAELNEKKALEERSRAEVNEKKALEERDRVEQERKKAERARLALMFNQTKALHAGVYLHEFPVNPDPTTIVNSPKLREKIDQLENILAQQRALLGNDDPDTIATMEYLAEECWIIGDVKRTVALYPEVVNYARAKLGFSHATTQEHVGRLANFYRSVKQYKEAIDLLEEFRAHLRKESVQLPNLPTGRYRVNIVTVDRFPDARGGTWFGGPADRRLPLFPPKQSSEQSFDLVFAHICQEDKQFARAEKILREALREEPVAPEQNAAAFRIRCELGFNLVRQKKFIEAEPILRDCLNTFEQRANKARPDYRTAYVRVLLGASLAHHGTNLMPIAPAGASIVLAAAESLLIDGYRDLRANRDTMLHVRMMAVANLAQFYRTVGRSEEINIVFDVRQAKQLAREKKWDEASMAFGDLLIANFNNPQTSELLWCYTASLCQMQHDQSRYREFCQEMLKRFGSTTKSHVAAQTALTCLLAPNAVPDIKPIIGLAELAATQGTNEASFPFFALTRSLAAYRTGDWNGALHWCAKTRSATNVMGYHEATALAIEGMAKFQLGRTEELAPAVTRARELLEVKMQTDLGEEWHEWLVGTILLREANNLLRKKSSVRPK